MKHFFKFISELVLEAGILIVIIFFSIFITLKISKRHDIPFMIYTAWDMLTIYPQEHTIKTPLYSKNFENNEKMYQFIEATSLEQLLAADALNETGKNTNMLTITWNYVNNNMPIVDSINTIVGTYFKDQNKVILNND